AGGVRPLVEVVAVLRSAAGEDLVGCADILDHAGVRDRAAAGGVGAVPVVGGAGGVARGDGVAIELEHRQRVREEDASFDGFDGRACRAAERVVASAGSADAATPGAAVVGSMRMDRKRMPGRPAGLQL